MTNIYLQQSVPVSMSDRAGEILSAVILALSAVMALVAYATV